MAKEFKISTLRLKELEQELFYLKTTREKEVAEQIKEARSFGDLSENSEYDEAKNEQAKVESRIAELEAMLKVAKVISEEEMSADTVHLGSKVRVYDKEFDEEVTYLIVGTAEASPSDGKISAESPIGKALLGAKAGKTVHAETPGGVAELKVLEIIK